MNDDNTRGAVSAAGVGHESSKAGTFFQKTAIVFAAPAIVWSGYMAWSTAFPPPCGNWRNLLSLGVAENWLICLPVSLFGLAAGLLVKKGSPSLRRICIISSVVLLGLQITTSILLHRLHCPEIVQIIGPLKANPNLNHWLDRPILWRGFSAIQ